MLSVPDEVIRSSTGLAGGCGGSKEMCGALIGGIQAIGLKHGRVDKADDRKPAMERSGELIDAFHRQFGTISCHKLTGDFPDFNSPERREHCTKFVAFVAQRLRELLKTK